MHLIPAASVFVCVSKARLRGLFEGASGKARRLDSRIGKEKELKVLRLEEMTNLIWIIFIALVVIISIALVLEEGAELSIFGLMLIVGITAFFLLQLSLPISSAIHRFSNSKFSIVWIF